MSIQLFDLSGKTALVTGSSRGIGRAIAEAFAACGAHVIINGTNQPRLDSACDALQAEGYSVTNLRLDVTDENAIKQAFADFEQQNIAIDILVNNAGVQFRKPMLELETEDWQHVLDTNLTAAFVMGREAARGMLRRGSGKIINIGSLTSELARKTISPYAVSKGGIRMLTRMMAAEWAEQGVQANAIGPGFFKTDMNEALISNDQFDSWVKQRTPAGRWGNPDELAGVAIFLASAASNYVNGQLIFVDGGMTAVM